MNKLTIIALCAVAVLAGAALGVLTRTYIHPNTATVTDISLQRMFGGKLLAEDETMDWSIVENGTTYEAALNVTNTGNIDVIVTVIADWGIMTDWTLTWEHDGILLQPNEWANGTLSLYVPADAASGATYNWNCNVTATEA